MITVVALEAVLVVWGAASGRLARYSVTMPILLVGIGALLAAGSKPLLTLDPSGEIVHELLELTLAVLLFVDATEVSAGWLRESARYPLRLLGMGFPLTVAAGLAVGAVLFPDADLWIVAMLAAALAATDAALASPVIQDHRIPGLLRRIIDVESGLNDGLATPVVLFFLTAAVSAETGSGGSAPLVEAIVDLATGAVAGLVVGIGGARLLRATNRWGWETASGSRIAVLALPVLAYAIGDGLGGNGFVAAYVAGIAAGSIGADLVTRSLPLAADTGTVLAAVVWFVFGTIVPRALEGGIDWQVVAYAVLSLTVVRMLPVAISLFGSGFPRRDVLFLGWIGPRGLASILFGIIALEELERAGLQQAAHLVVDVIVVTVVLSVVVHGLTAGAIAARWRQPDPSSAGPA